MYACLRAEAQSADKEELYEVGLGDDDGERAKGGSDVNAACHIMGSTMPLGELCVNVPVCVVWWSWW